MPTSLRSLVCATGVFLTVCVSALSADAGVMHPPGVGVFASPYFDGPNSFATRGVSQQGRIFATVAGVPGARQARFEGGRIVRGRNPIRTFLPHHGDGVVGAGDGIGAVVSTEVFARGRPQFFRADLDFDDTSLFRSTPMLFGNLSPNIYRFDLSLSYAHHVFARGPDAGIRSDLDLELNGREIFTSELISDTVTGNFRNRPVRGFGGLLRERGVHQFSFVLSPFQFASVGVDYTLEGPPIFGMADGYAEGHGRFFLSIDNVTQVPEPSLPIGAILLGMGCIRWRRSKRVDPRAAATAS